MLGNIIDDIKLERAKFARDIEYLTEEYLTDEVDDIVESVSEDVLGFRETSDMLLEATADLDRISDNDDNYSKMEIDKIMEATDDMTFDELIGANEMANRI